MIDAPGAQWACGSGRAMITLRNNTAERHVAELAVEAETDLILGRGVYGLPDISKIHRQHARIGWRTGQSHCMIWTFFLLSREVSLRPFLAALLLPTRRS